jgi:serine phosphatase RsbU (regulator of sigma subunit)
MQLKRVGVLFFRNQEVCCCMEAYGFDGAAWKEFCMKTDADLAHAINRFHNDFSVDYLPPNIKTSFRAEGFLHIIPVRSKEKLVGALLIGEKLSEASLQNEDLEFIGSVAKQASVAVENAFLYEELAGQERMKHELAIARRIQLESLPQTTPDIAGLQVAGISIPALEVGGDYYDYLNGDARTLTVIVGDVSGKGTSAALYMSKVQGILRSLHAFGLSPRELFIRANSLLCKDLEKRSFITAMGGTFRPADRTLTLSRAGHLPLFHYSRSTKHTSRIIPRGLGLGLSALDVFANELEEATVNYDAGDVFVFVTDGITEGQRAGGEEFGEERLMELLSASAEETAEKIRENVIAAVERFVQGARQHDDQTVVVVRAV